MRKILLIDDDVMMASLLKSLLAQHDLDLISVDRPSKARAGLDAGAELILLGFNPHGAEHLKDLLVGQILWVEPRQLIPVALVYGVVLIGIAVFDLRRQRLLFYLLFAVTITVSVQLIGVFLVFASLILPALAAASLRQRPVGFGYLVGLVGYALGLVVSLIADLPTGAAIVCALALAASFAAGIVQLIGLSAAR